MLITPEQHEKENNDPELKRCEEEHSKFQAMVQSSKLSLWGSLLTINGFFIAFTLHNTIWPFEIHLVFMSLFTITVFMLLWLFYYDSWSKREWIKAFGLITERRKLELREQDYKSKGLHALEQSAKASKITQVLNTTGELLERLVIIMTTISISGILLVQIFLEVIF
jgi:hypothetical protein